MLKQIVTLITSFAIFTNAFSQSQSIFSGKITEQKKGAPLAGASIYFPDLKIGGITDSSGMFQIKNLPKSKEMIVVSFNGYNHISETIDLSVTKAMNFSLKESVTELGEVVVTGLSKADLRKRTASPIAVVNATQLRQLTATNIIDAIATQAGISQVTTGPGISKPVIRGLGYNRVMVVNNGIRQEGQQWGDEHGVEIDEYDIGSVEILKGPASLAFGSDALAGVINFLPAQTLTEGVIKGGMITNYQTNNGLFGNSVNMGGNKNGINWDIRYSNKQAHAYKNKFDGYVFNSGFKESNIAATLGINRAWGYSHLNFSSFNLSPGIIEGERDVTSGQFVKHIALNDSTEDETIADNADFKSYKSYNPYQKIHHYKLVLNNHFILGKNSLKATLGWQQNQRLEFDNVLKPNEYSLYFHMNTLNYSIRYNLEGKKNLNFSFGVNGMYQNSQNKGVEFIIPDYQIFDIGTYTLAKKTWKKWTLSGGLRYDLRNEKGYSLWVDENDMITTNPDANSEELFSAFHLKYHGISGSIGTTYQFNDKYYTKLNFSKGFRAPNIAELSAHGVHEGTAYYLIGSSALTPENSFQTDYTFGVNTEHITAEANLFFNHISNFIFIEKLNSISGGDSLTNGYNTFRYTSGNANLYGAEFTIDFHPHPLDWLHFENSFSFVQSKQVNQPDSMKNLPFTPSPKLHSEIRANLKKLGKFLDNSFIRFAFDNYFKQNNFYSAFKTETATATYILLNAGIGSDIISNKRTLFSVYISINNLTNTTYQNHLSRLKYLSENNATGRTGVYNMGRNFSFKLIIPFYIKKNLLK